MLSRMLMISDAFKEFRGPLFLQIRYEEGGVFLLRRRHSEPSTDTCINPYIVLNVRVGFGRFQPIAVAR